jgi:hypothetical protein
MESRMSTLGLEITDWLALIFAVLFFILLWALLRPPGRKNHISISRVDNSPIVIDQSDRSKRHTKIDTKVNVHVNQSKVNQAASERAATSAPLRRQSNAGPDDSEQAFMLVAAGIALFGTVFYLQHFETIVLVTRAFFLGLMAYSLLGLLAARTNWIEPVSNEYRWFAAHAVVSMVGAAVLLNGQALIDPHVQSIAQQEQLSFKGILRVMAQLTWVERFSCLASFIMCVLTMLTALRTALAIWRTYLVSFWEEDLGSMGRIALRFLPEANGPVYLLWSGFSLVMAVATKFVWLPHVLQAS